MNESAALHRASPGGAAVWLMAARPRTLWAAAAPVWVGAAVASSLGPVDWPAVTVAAVCAGLIQIGANFANDYFDHRNGADTEERIGPLRVTQAGLVSPSAVAAATAISFGLALLGGLYLVYHGGWPILAIGTASIVSGLLYTGGPWPLGYNGLGDLFVFLFFGLAAVAGTAYVASGAWPAAAFEMAIPVGCLATAILVVNNQRDRVTDAKTGKRTLAVRLGPMWMKAEYAALLGAAYLVPVAGASTGRYPIETLAVLATLPEAIGVTRSFFRTDGPALNPLLGRTARLLAIYSAALGAAWFLAT